MSPLKPTAPCGAWMITSNVGRIKQFFNFVNQINGKIKFMMKIEEGERLPFLDVEVIRSNGTLKKKLCRKSASSELALCETVCAHCVGLGCRIALPLSSLRSDSTIRPSIPVGAHNPDTATCVTPDLEDLPYLANIHTFMNTGLDIPTHKSQATLMTQTGPLLPGGLAWQCSNLTCAWHSRRLLATENMADKLSRWPSILRRQDSTASWEASEII
ncbi:unnamed protein product [Protopolystoma xenopodis]|uniref:Uncharacterized protein n=1 Tax=Protopolystoma xenopodis TaxID=117903 RepID=A0A3S5FCT4_9PLAT|nr:unnamed protein product [Protopolystoma xenopodis]